MRQIIEKVQAHAQQELQHIHQQTVDKIAGSDQYNVYLNIIVIEDFAEKAVQITDIRRAVRKIQTGCRRTDQSSDR